MKQWHFVNHTNSPWIPNNFKFCWCQTSYFFSLENTSLDLSNCSKQIHTCIYYITHFYSGSNFFPSLCFEQQQPMIQKEACLKRGGQGSNMHMFYYYYYYYYYYWQCDEFPLCINGGGRHQPWENIGQNKPQTNHRPVQRSTIHDALKGEAYLTGLVSPPTLLSALCPSSTSPDRMSSGRTPSPTSRRCGPSASNTAVRASAPWTRSWRCPPLTPSLRCAAPHLHLHLLSWLIRVNT